MKNKKIIVNFENVLSELEQKKIKLCFLGKKGLFIEDEHKEFYQMEIYRHSSCLDKLIEEGISVEFNRVENIVSGIKDWTKEVWGVSEVKAFITSNSLQMINN
ncbi:hypothetical protein [Paenibacillus donghaensis]|uniref:Uncharacterized protein n=1 Tax=Paenibacillus donghaensis TaxID=414771 RepID=A0A2Z2KAR2_9BACL|nr:hypothetical protein [Paenibacillus donghaensis]ASA22724.1 hypothetical protein B9T62_19145 [Paenibacillus donghaensis]